MWRFKQRLYIEKIDTISLQCGVQEDNSNVFIDLVAQILSEPCYNILRTQEQLGYIVFAGVRKANGAKGLRILVQSTKHPGMNTCQLFIQWSRHQWLYTNSYWFILSRICWDKDWQVFEFYDGKCGNYCIILLVCINLIWHSRKKSNRWVRTTLKKIK